MGRWSSLLSLALLAARAVLGRCHGMLQEPASRNVVHNSDYCPHCLNAGGPSRTYAGRRRWPNAKHGVCGDPADGEREHEAGGRYATRRVTATYEEGQTVRLRVRITAAHGGRFSFGVCPLPRAALRDAAEERRVVTQACFDEHPLTNAADGSRHWWLGRQGEGEYVMKFRLPPGVRCERCVLQWHYESGNSCTIPGTPDRHVVSDGMEPCDRSSNMEEFWNCADVAIAGGRPQSRSKPSRSKPSRSKPSRSQPSKPAKKCAPRGQATCAPKRRPA